MEETLTLTLSGNSSVLEAQYFPPIELSPKHNYVLALIGPFTSNSIPNIDEGCNKFYIGEHQVVLPTGSWEIQAINEYLQTKAPDFRVLITVDESSHTSSIRGSYPIDFTQKDSIGPILGFSKRILPQDKEHKSDYPVNIQNVNVLRVECNISTGAYANDRKEHIIHEFYPSVPAGYKIIEVPSQIIYLPINTRVIDHIRIRIVDQIGKLVNLRGETLTVRLHIKPFSF